MPRPLRQELAGGVFHVWARGNNRRLLFLDRRDREVYLGLLARVVLRQGWLCLAYCLMGNHVHLLIETPRPNLADGMRRLHGEFGQRFNARHSTSGHVFQGRYDSNLITTDAQLWVTARYIALNPVAAGICRLPEHYEWSSHAGVLNGRGRRFVNRGRLFEYFGSAGGDPYERYREFIAMDLPAAA